MYWMQSWNLNLDVVLDLWLSCLYKLLFVPPRRSVFICCVRLATTRRWTRPRCPIDLWGSTSSTQSRQWRPLRPIPLTGRCMLTHPFTFLTLLSSCLLLFIIVVKFQVFLGNHGHTIACIPLAISLCAYELVNSLLRLCQNKPMNCFNNM